MLQRVRDFGIAHRDRFPEASAAGKAFATIARVVAEIEALGVRKRVVAAEGREAMMVMRGTIMARVRVIARAARGLDRGVAARKKLVVPSRQSYESVVETAAVFLKEAVGHEAALMDFGMPATCLAEIQSARDALVKALAERRAGRSGGAEAKADLAAAISTGCDAARTLDIIVPNMVADDPGLFAAWRRDRLVVEGKRAKAAGAPPTVVAIATVPKAS